MGVFKKMVEGERGGIVVTEETNIFEEIMKSKEKVTLFCSSYFYTGTIEAVNGDTVVLSGAKIVYDTGSFNDKSWKDAQDLGTNQWFVRISFIESFGVLNKN